MQLSTPSKELADIEFKRIINVTWPVLASLYSIQALASQGSISQWQIIYVAGNVLAAGISFLIQYLTSSDYAFTPLVIYMLIAPIVLGTQPENPWMSYGLLGVGASMYFAAINSGALALVLITFVTAFQSWATYRNLSSVSDTTDMRLLGGYFSTLWTFGIGAMMMVIRNRYLKAVEKVDDRIETLKNRISERLHGISKKNREDFRNLKLHGTVLNSLILARTNPSAFADRDELAKTIQNEILELESIDTEMPEVFKDLVTQEIEKRTLKRANLTSLMVNATIADQQLRDLYLEVIREVLLNIEKHTKATEVSISISETGQGQLAMTILENSPAVSEITDMQSYLFSSASSHSLRRLLSSIPAELRVSFDEETQNIVFEIYPSTSSGSAGSTREIYSLRNESLMDFSINFARATSILGVLFLPGYFLVGETGWPLAFLAAQALLLAYQVYFKLHSKKFLVASILLSLVTPLYLSQNIESCSQVSYFPWLINTIMTSAFSFALLYPNKVMKWFPLALLTLEMLLLPFNYPSECQNIFLGSIPGIPLIVVFSFVLTSIRKRAFKLDSQQIKLVFEDEQNIDKIEEVLHREYGNLLRNLKQVTPQISRTNHASLPQLLDIQIQRIRAYLICSEQFESKIVQDFYHFANLRISRDIPTRITVIGDHFFELDRALNMNQYFKRLDKYLGTASSEISLVRIGFLTIEVAVEDPEGLKAKTSELSMDYPEVKLLIRSFT